MSRADMVSLVVLKHGKDLVCGPQGGKNSTTQVCPPSRSILSKQYRLHILVRGRNMKVSWQVGSGGPKTTVP